MDASLVARLPAMRWILGPIVDVQEYARGVEVIARQAVPKPRVKARNQWMR